MKRRGKRRGVTDIVAGLLILISVLVIVIGVYNYKQQQKILAEQGVEIHIVARQWVFEPDEIVVRKGQKVTLILTSADVTHGFMLDAFNINVIVHPGEIVKITFVPDKTGEFEFRCSVYCGEPWPGSGLGHWVMRGTLRVIE